jgi:RimJ/RimL family protein N-acetyltransferase
MFYTNTRSPVKSLFYAVAEMTVLRDVVDADLPIFFEHQRDPEATRMADFPARDYEAFMAHWQKILADDTLQKKTIVFEQQVAGNVVSWEQDGRRLVGYWLGKEFWGKGLATRGLAELIAQVTVRPLYAYVAATNIGSIRVLEKCGFVPSAEDDDLYVLAT